MYICTLFVKLFLLCSFCEMKFTFSVRLWLVFIVFMTSVRSKSLPIPAFELDPRVIITSFAALLSNEVCTH